MHNTNLISSNYFQNYDSLQMTHNSAGKEKTGGTDRLSRHRLFPALIDLSRCLHPCMVSTRVVATDLDLPDFLLYLISCLSSCLNLLIALLNILVQFRHVSSPVPIRLKYGG